jgi:hypothetical protein
MDREKIEKKGAALAHLIVKSAIKTSSGRRGIGLWPVALIWFSRLFSAPARPPCRLLLISL